MELVFVYTNLFKSIFVQLADENLFCNLTRRNSQ